MNIPAAARAQAESTLTSAAVVTRRTKDSFVAGQGAVEGTPQPVFSGACSVGPPDSSDRTGSGGDDHWIDTRIVRIPVDSSTAATTSGDPGAIEVGDQLAVDGDQYTVTRIQKRTTEVLRRIRVVEKVDAEGVPA